MKLGGFLGKPRWQAKDAATRRDAVAHDDDPDLRANLGRFAREDPDAGVRIAALKRGADPGIAQGLAHDDADADVRAQARALWLDLLTGTHPAAPSLVERSRLLMAQDDGELIERVVRGAREPELRRLALGRVTRPALLQERALEDPDAAIRLALVERIDDEAQLARLAERARKSDKNVSRRARERAEALRIGRGDSTTLEQRARSLCEQLEQLLRDPRDDDAEARIDQHWNGIAAAVPATLCARYAAARALLASSRTPPAPRQEALRQEPVPPMPAAVAEIPDAAPAGTEAEPAAAQHVEHGGILRHPQRIVPGQDDRRRADIDVGMPRRQVGHQLDVVGHERVVVEMVLGRPQAVEAAIGGQPREPDLFLPDAIVGAVVPAVAGEDHHHPNVHGFLRIFV